MAESTENHTTGLPHRRLPLLDSARGAAIVLMIFFHFTHDIRSFGSKESAIIQWLPAWYWNWFPEFVGLLFFSIVGVSAKVKYEQIKNPHFRHFVRQALKVGVFALLISIVTYFVVPAQTVYFGTLHCIAVSSALVYPFLKYPRFAFAFGAVLAPAGFALEQMRFSSNTFMWLGFAAKGQTGGDWYPLLPWFAVVLVGVGLGHFWLKNASAKAAWQPLGVLGALSFLGRHALVIYLIHQPILLGLLWALGVIQVP